MRVKTNRSKKFVERIFSDIPAYISGSKSDTHSIGRVFWSAFVRRLYSKIHESYAIRSEGGTDELGNKFLPLKKKTIAQRPIGKGNLGGLGLTKKKSGTALRNRERGLLSPEENLAWKRKYSIVLASLQRRMGTDRAKKIAASVAWNYVKSNGAKTKKELLGNRDVLIMRVTDSIFNSLKPSEGSDYSYRPNKNQIYNRVNNKLEIGTKIEYAKYHNNSRPVIPKDIDPWIEEARDHAMEIVKKYIVERIL